MASRYKHQFDASMKPLMVSIDGAVTVGTGGLPDATTASGTTYGAGAPSGWVGGYSGVIGLYKAGVQTVNRVSVGSYQILLEDGWAQPIQSVQVTPFSGATATILAIPQVTTVISGNGAAGQGGGYPTGMLQGQVTVAFINGSGTAVELPAKAGFYVTIRLCDSSAGQR